MFFLENFSLLGLNTFAIDVKARYFFRAGTRKTLLQFIDEGRHKISPLLILGGGSNVLFTGDFDGLILQPAIKGIEASDGPDAQVMVTAGAGENWDDLVAWCVGRNLGGLENLSLIPGTVGAAPIQNIGAYGVELGQHLECLEAIDLHTGEIITFSARECGFGYRTSVFKTIFKGRYIILSVTFRLYRDPDPCLDYRDLREEARARGLDHPDIAQVRDMVIGIRRRKLPDPAITGNAGSFFKNPEISEVDYQRLVRSFPDIVAYRQVNGNYKLAAGWMIDSCGWKGKRIGDAGVHDRQALVLVNYGKANGSDVLHLAGLIRNSVKDKFGIELEPEVNII